MAATTASLSSASEVDDRVAVVTGGSRGIGRAIAERLAERGCRVVVAGRQPDAVQAAVDAIRSRGGVAEAIPCDVTDEDSVAALVERTVAWAGALDILVNNAGATWGAPIAEFDEAAWERVLALNVKGVFHLTKFLLPLLQAAGTAENPARVINIGSVDGLHVPGMETYSYSASKAAVHQLTRHLAKRLAPSVTVNAIAPGPFESKMMAATLAAAGDAIASAVPMKRIGQPDDMAGTAIFLSSRASSYITGTVIPVGGGLATIV